MGILTNSIMTESVSLENYTGKISDTDNYMVEALNAVRESEENWNMIQQAIFTNEASYFAENGEEYVYESVDFSAMFNKIKEFFKKIIDKIKELFGKFMAALNAFVMDNKAYVKKYRTQILSRFDKVKDFHFKGYVFTIDHNAVGSAISAMDKVSVFEDNKLGFGDTVTSVKQDYLKKLDSTEVIEEIRGAAISAISKSGSKSLTQSEFTKELKEAFRDGASSPESLDKSDIQKLGGLASIIREIETADQDKKDATNAYKASDKKIKDIIKEFEDAEKKTNKTITNDMSADKVVSTSEIASYFNKMAGLYKQQASIIQSINGALLTALKDRARQGKSICTKILTGGLEKNESAGVEHYTENSSIFGNIVLQ